jgi:hypothetical protein
MSAEGYAKVFMIMCKCLSVISSSSSYRQETVPTRVSRRDLYEILSLDMEHSPTSSSPSTLRGDRRAHRVYLTCPAKIKIYMYSSPFSTPVFSVLPADKSKPLSLVSARFSLISLSTLALPTATLKMHIANT